MSKTVEQAIQELQTEIASAEASLRSKKETVNTLCKVISRPPAYVIADTEEPAVTGTIRPDQFYGQPLASSVRTILEMRRAANLGAGTVAEIYDALVAGGFRFETKTEEIARKSLRNSLAKNTALFHKLPNGRFGLRAWYPNARDMKRGSSASESSANEAEDTAGSADADEAVTANGSDGRQE